jgi:hypothetical protein
MGNGIDRRGLGDAWPLGCMIRIMLCHGQQRLRSAASCQVKGAPLLRAGQLFDGKCTGSVENGESRGWGESKSKSREKSKGESLYGDTAQPNEQKERLIISRIRSVEAFQSNAVGMDLVRKWGGRARSAERERSEETATWGNCTERAQPNENQLIIAGRTVEFDAQSVVDDRARPP